MAGLTSRSEGVGDGDDGGDDGAAPRFLQKQKTYKLSTNQMHTPCIVGVQFEDSKQEYFSNLSIQ